MNHLAEELGRLLLRRHWRVTTAESCTGGGIASAITNIPGSSQWFEQGFITYSNTAKTDVLGVDESLLIKHGAVSQMVVDAMAQGALQRAKANIAVAVSGIAGPDGGTAEKPVGTVWLAWALAGEWVESECFHFTGNRYSVRQQATEAALKGLIQRIGKNTV